MFNELVKAFLFIFIAEMGDKTQILAMTFATKFKVQKVLLGVLIGSALNHGLAIAFGAYLSNLIPINTIQMIAGISFIFFGLWSLKKEDDEEEKETSKKFGPVLTVALAFFIGELGDKTQLTAMTLATGGQFPIFILFGTVLGMIATSGIGIFVGSKVGEKIPELAITLISSGVFLFFGILKLFQTVPKEYLTSLNIVIFFTILVFIVYILLKPTIEDRRSGRKTALEEVATALYIQAHEIKEAVDKVCLGEEACGGCEGKKCIIGFTRKALSSAVETAEYILPSEWNELPDYIGKNFEDGKILEALSMTIAHLLKYDGGQDKNYVVNRTREALETLAFGEAAPYIEDGNEYFNMLKKKNKIFANKIIKRVKEINNNEEHI